MKKSALYLLLIFSLATNLAVAGSVAYHYWCKAERRSNAGLTCGQKPFGRFMRENLQLEADEISRFQTLFSQNREDLFLLRDQVQKQRKVLFDLLAQPEVDLVQVDQQIEKVAALQARMQKIVVNQIINMKSSLSEEKQQKLLDVFRQRSGYGPFGRGPLSPGRGKKMGRWW
ncbi:MAG: periplasmic heavy metal sensor [bacterium]